ncbi:MAG: viperin family antiviral radical SAM protein [Spirochaetales bacterium]
MVLYQNQPNLTLNWHFINACNMQCKFCFANKGSSSFNHNYDSFLEKCATIFTRINFVGGEPTLFKKLPYLVAKAQSLGMETSIVTNGYEAIKGNNLKELLQTFSKMKTVGISIDSLDSAINKKIGRQVNGYVLTQSELLAFCKTIRDMGVELKINTVVNSFNKNEDFNFFIKEANPNRWKIFQVLPVGKKEVDDEFCISNSEYNEFRIRHEKLSTSIFTEDNDLMIDSYIMVNAKGYFIGTAPYEIKPTQKSLYENDSNIIDELEEMNYNISKYNLRYENVS